MEHDEYTEPLANGAEIPDHPDSTTARKVVSVQRVRDSEDGTILKAALHQNELKMLMGNQVGGLSHLYRFAIVNGKIFHTRPRVILEVRTTDA